MARSDHDGRASFPDGNGAPAAVPPRKARHPSPELHAALVDSLFGDLASLLAGAACGILAAAVAASWMESAFLWHLTLAIAYVVAIRVAILVSYRRRLPAGDLGSARRWEAGYAAGAFAFSLLIGVVCAYAVVNRADLSVQVLTVIVATGYTAGISGRNAGRPNIVAGQVALGMGPVAGAFLWIGGPVYQTVAAMVFLYYFSALGISRSIHGMLSGAIDSRQRNERLAAELAGRNRLFGAALASMSHGMCVVDGKGGLLVWNARFMELLGIDPLSPDVAEGNPLARLVSSRVLSNAAGSLSRLETLEAFSSNLRGTRRATFDIVLVDGSRRILTFDPFPDGGSVVVLEDPLLHVVEPRAGPPD